MKENSISYFNNIIMPLIHQKHPDVFNEMSFVIMGSVGLGIDDELSDMEAAIYLPDEIWKHNGLLQITLNKCLADTNLWQPNGSIISVYPLSWMLDGQGEKLLDANTGVPWQEMSIDSMFGLFVLHNQPVWHDPQDRLGKLIRKTTPEKMPEIFWKKALLTKLDNFVRDGMQEIKKCVERKNFLDAYVPFGDAVKALQEIGFILCRKYYPFRKHLSWAFSRLPLPIVEYKLYFDQLSAAASWQERLDLMETIYNAYKDYIIANLILPELDFNRVDLNEMPLQENEFDNCKNILDNPNWLSELAAKKENAVKLGYEPGDYWVVDWWGIE